MPRLLLLVLFSFFCLTTFALTDNYNWIFLKKSNDITIYYRESEINRYEELKFITTFNASSKDILTIISNVSRLPEWSYICVYTEIINAVSPNEWYYYYITDTPWPLVDRDVVLHVTVTIDSLTNATTILSESINGLVAEKDGFVRIKRLRSKWVIIPVSKGFVNIEFYFSTDPGGSIPTWLLNSAISYGPIKTLTTLRGMLEDLRLEVGN